MANDLALTLKNALLDFLAPLGEAANDPQTLAVWLETLGQTTTVTGDPALLQIAQNAATLIQQLQQLNPDALQSFAGIAAVLNLAKSISAIQTALQQFAQSPARVQAAGDLAEEIVALLLASYLRRRQPIAFRVAAVLTVIDARECVAMEPAVIQNGVTLRYSRTLDTFHFNTVSDLLSKPGDVLKAAYFPNQLAAGADAWRAAAQLFPNLSYLADQLGVAWRIEYLPSVPSPAVTPADGSDNDIDREGDDLDRSDDTDDPAVDETDVGSSDAGGDDDSDDTGDGNAVPAVPLPDTYYSSYFPGFRIVVLSAASNSGKEVALEIQCSSASHPGATSGYIVSVVGSFNAAVTFESWRITLTASGHIPAFVLKPSGFGLVSSAVPLTGGAAKFLLERLPDPASPGPVFLLGSATGTRLEIGTASVAADFSYDPSHIAASVSAKVSKCAFVIKPGDGDSFLSSVLPASGLSATFDFGLTYSSDNGLSIQGGAGLDVTLPIGVSLGGVVTIPSLHLALLASGSGLQGEVSLTVGLSIGPLQASVDRLGLTAGMTFPEGGGNFGPADFTINFKPPSGVGLAIDSAGVSGGGFLGFDPAKHEYTGVLQLQFNELALQAFGIITTQVAGKDGYSLLALIDANFPPVELGLGFTLNGVGGLLAVHRTASEDALRAAMKAGTLSTVLFPKNAITNAAQILAQLDALFPTAAGRFLFGPMALIGWGTPTVLTASIAVILELPEPIEIILLGVLQARFPAPDAPLVKINMDALGVIDFSQDELSLDATLFDSKLISFTISGDMALRVNWGSNSEFLLSIGGFHPQFTPPAGFPSLKRLTIDMPSGIVSKLRLAAYLAVTSNSLQFGAALDVFIGVSGFGLSGHLGFDALLQLNPFHFEADISGSIALTAGGDDLMSVSLDASLTGPAPWNIAGKFKVHIVFFDVHISFSQTWGLGAPSQQVSNVDVGALLNTTLADPRSWNVQLPAGLSALVSTRAVADATAIFAHPLALVGVHERLVPLDLAITHFGQATPSGATQFSITKFQLGAAILDYDKVQDQFAPAQFFDLSDSARLSRPSYELHDAGVVMKSTLVKNGAPVARTTDYETYFIDTPGSLRVDEGVPQPFPWGDIVGILQTGAAAQKAISKAGNRRYTAPGNPITVAEAAFALVDTVSLTPQAAVPAGKTTYSDVQAQLTGALASSPVKRDNLQIVSIHEVVAA